MAVVAKRPYIPEKNYTVMVFSTAFGKIKSLHFFFLIFLLLNQLSAN